MFLPAILLAAAFIIGWTVDPLRRAIATATAVWLVTAGLLGVSWTVWDETASDIAGFFVGAAVLLAGMIAFALLGRGLKAKRSSPA